MTLIHAILEFRQPARDGVAKEKDGAEEPPPKALPLTEGATRLTAANGLGFAASPPAAAAAEDEPVGRFALRNLR